MKQKIYNFLFPTPTNSWRFAFIVIGISLGAAFLLV